MNILVIAPHPDDEVLGCGGSIAAHSAAGDRVTALLLTRGDPAFFPPELIARSREELCQAHSILGVVENIFLDFPAPGLDGVGTHLIADSLKQVIERVRPAVIYTPFGGDLHADHKVTYIATLVAARPIGTHPVSRILCYETLSETEWGDTLTQNTFVPNVFRNISEHVETKVSAMACYKSQLREAPHPRQLETIRMLAYLRGTTCGFRAAEAFALIRELIDCNRRDERVS